MRIIVGIIWPWQNTLSFATETPRNLSDICLWAAHSIGVTDTMFNPVNAIFGRLLKTPDGHRVTLAYWQQKEDVSNDEVPYFEGK